MNFCEISKNTFSHRTPPVAAFNISYLEVTDNSLLSQKSSIKINFVSNRNISVEIFKNIVDLQIE